MSVVYQRMYVCMSVCLSVSMYVCNTINFENLDVGSSLKLIGYISRRHGSNSYMKDIRSRSRSQEQKRSTCNKSGSIKHRAMKFVCKMGFSAAADRMARPPSLSRKRKWPRVTKCTHSRVVSLRLEGNLVIITITCVPAMLSEAGIVFSNSACACLSRNN